MKTKRSKKEMSVSYEPYLLENLKDPDYAAGYLSACFTGLSDDDFELFFDALMQVAKARGITPTAKSMGMTRDALYKAFTRHRNPNLKTFTKLLDSFGLHLMIVPKEQTV